MKGSNTPGTCPRIATGNASVTGTAHFALETTDARARAGAADPSRRRGRNARLHAGRHGGHRQGRVARRARGRGGVDRAGQHLSSVSCVPGAEVVGELGGVHDFMRWQGPVLTDSGGYQVFSLASTRDIDENGVTFRNHIDGSSHRFTPESVIDIQRQLGADVIMAFDECPPGGVTHEGGGAREPQDRPPGWLAAGTASKSATARHGAHRPQTLFPVLQGNVYDDLRAEQVNAALAMGDWAGFGIGGLSVGEAKEDMWRTVELLDGLDPPGPPPLPHGRGLPGRPPGGHRPRLRHVRLRRPHPQRPPRHRVDPGRGTDQPEGRAFPPGPRPHRPLLRLLRLPPATTAPTSATSSCSANVSATASSRSTTCTSCWR